MNKNDFCYVEYRQFPYRNKGESPLIVGLDDPLLKQGGFRSAYQVNEEGKRWIEERKTVGGLADSDIPVWSPQLVVDFDDSPDEAEFFRQLLVHDGISFEMYDSGNRSIHFHVDREAEPSADLPYSDRQYIKTVMPKADQSLYSAMHPFRLVGTVHEKTGRAKTLLEKNEGRPLTIPIVKRPDYSGIKQVVPTVSIFEDALIMGLSRGFREGSRYKHMLVLAYKLKERGESPGFIKGWVKNANMLNSPRLPEERLNRIFRSVLNGQSDSEL